MKNLFVNYWGTKTLMPPALLLLNCFLGNASIWTAIGDFWQFLPKLLGQEIFVIAVTGSNQRISPIQSRSLRRDWEFLTLNLRLRDETKKNLQSRTSRRDQDLLSAFSGFQTRTRIPLIWSRFSRRDREFWNLPSFPEIRLERPHYFACNFWEANYIKCRAPHFARCSPILKWPSHVLRASILW